MKRLLFKMFYQGLLSRNIILPFAKNIRYIFLFHDVSPYSATYHHSVYSTHPQVFQRITEWIEKNFKIVGLSELTDENYENQESRNLASIAFDDGFHSILEFVFPYLNKKQIPFTVFANQQAMQENWIWCNNLLMASKHKNEKYLREIYEQFVPSNEVGFSEFAVDPVTCLSNRRYLNDDYSMFFDPAYTEQKVYLDEKDVKFLHSQGVTIGNHTKTHKQLSTCSDESIREEIVDNKIYLENLLDIEIDHFAIPFGFHTTYNDFAIDVARENHKFVYDTEKNRCKVSKQRITPRICLTNENVSTIVSYVNYPIIRNIAN